MMHSATLPYQFSAPTGLVRHSLLPTFFVRDSADNEEGSSYRIDAQALSGDYFVTLATELDTLSRRIVNLQIRSEIEDRVSDLIYLQDHYKITKKESE